MSCKLSEQQQVVIYMLRQYEDWFDGFSTRHDLVDVYVRFFD